MAICFTDEQVMRVTGAHRAQTGGHADYIAVCTDTRALKPRSLFVALVGERFDAHEFLASAHQGGALGLVVQKGRARASLPSSATVFEVDDTLLALGALAHAHREKFRIPVGAITGSNGKTTTKELVGSILATRGPILKTQGNLNNEIGVPLTLFNLESSHVAAVIEMGMNHPGEIGRLTAIAAPDAGMITAVQPAHLEGLGSIEGIAKAKGELFHGLSATAIACVNVDDAHIVKQAQSSGKKTLTFGRDAAAQVRLKEIQTRGLEGLQLVVGYAGKDYTFKLQLLGAHNAQNACAAFAMGVALGCAPEECVRGIEAAVPPKQRLQVLKTTGGVTILDDGYNANPASMKAGLETLSSMAPSGRAVAVLGDMLELGRHEVSAHEEIGSFAERHAHRVAFFGPRMRSAHAMAQSSFQNRAAHFEDVDALVAWLKNQLSAGDVLLVKGSRGMKLERVVHALTGTTEGGAH